MLSLTPHSLTPHATPVCALTFHPLFDGQFEPPVWEAWVGGRLVRADSLDLLVEAAVGVAGGSLTPPRSALA